MCWTRSHCFTGATRSILSNTACVTGTGSVSFLQTGRLSKPEGPAPGRTNGPAGRNPGSLAASQKAAPTDVPLMKLVHHRLPAPRGPRTEPWLPWLFASVKTTGLENRGVSVPWAMQQFPSTVGRALVPVVQMKFSRPGQAAPFGVLNTLCAPPQRRPQVGRALSAIIRSAQRHSLHRECRGGRSQVSRSPPDLHCLAALLAHMDPNTNGWVNEGSAHGGSVTCLGGQDAKLRWQGSPSAVLTAVPTVTARWHGAGVHQQTPLT